ncbi:MAG: tetraacyldisaccharide 4'-kinase [Planctomycetaceae bacterium]|nr:tetraacyldisaccharide 4'-kinase [Planctomycetaceae bacterium]
MALRSMNEHQFRRLISGEIKGAAAGAARQLLSVAAICYGVAVRFRNQLFDLQLKAVHRTGCPVISVGNLTTGGTGKTPMVACVVELLQRQGRRPGIVSRGYRADTDQGNDEKRVLEQNCPGVPHIQNPDRLAACEQLLRSEAADVIVLDDGFQHRRLHRDLNIVLIDATCPFGYERMLPRGLLREPISGLRRADVVVVTRADLVPASQLTAIESTVRSWAPRLVDRVHRVAFRPAQLLATSGRTLPLDTMLGARLFLLSGIGNPQAFEQTVVALGGTIVGARHFPDHHHYTADDVASVRQAAAERQATLILTTEKDLVKLDGHEDILAVRIAAAFEGNSQQRFAAMISEILSTR